MHLPVHHGLPTAGRGQQKAGSCQQYERVWAAGTCLSARRSAGQQNWKGLPAFCPAQQLLSDPCSQDVPGIALAGTQLAQLQLLVGMLLYHLHVLYPSFQDVPGMLGCAPRQVVTAD